MSGSKHYCSRDYYCKTSKGKVRHVVEVTWLAVLPGEKICRDIFPLCCRPRQYSHSHWYKSTCMHLFTFVQHISGSQEWPSTDCFKLLCNETSVCTCVNKKTSLSLLLVTIWQWPCWVHNIQWRRIPQVLLLGSTLLFCLIVRMKSFVTVV